MKYRLAALSQLALVFLFGCGEEQRDETGVSEGDARGLLVRTEAAQPGYTLIAPLKSLTTYLIDLDGKVAHEWEADCPPGNSVYLQDNGDLIRAGWVDNYRFQGGGHGGKVQRFDWGGKLLWDIDLSSDTMLAHHDIEVLPNGNLIVLAWEYKTQEEALAAGRAPELISEDGFWPDMLLEYRVAADGQAEVVWEWHAFDHLVQDRDDTRGNFGIVGDQPERIDINGDYREPRGKTAAERAVEEQRRRELDDKMRAVGYVGDREDREVVETGPPGAALEARRSDWLHTNGVDYDAEHDLLLLSVHHFNELWVLDHSTTSDEARSHSGGRYGRGGDLLYRLGNPAAYRSAEDGTVQRLFSQHDGTWVGSEETGLRVLVFNNGHNRPGGEHSSVDEFLLPFTAENGFGATRATLVWQYKAPTPESFYASFVSGAERLDNGNTLICNGVSGHLFEVNSAGTVVWEYKNPFFGDSTLQGHRGAGPARAGVRGQGSPPPRHAGQGPPPRGKFGAGPPAAQRPPRPNGPNGPPGGTTFEYGMFRATRIPESHPALAGRDL